MTSPVDLRTQTTGTISTADQAQIVSNFQTMLIDAGASERGAQRLANRLDHYISANPDAAAGEIGARAELLASHSKAAGGAAAESRLIGHSITVDSLEALMDLDVGGPADIANEDAPGASFIDREAAISTNAEALNAEEAREAELTSLLTSQTTVTPFPYDPGPRSGPDAGSFVVDGPRPHAPADGDLASGLPPRSTVI